MCLCNAESVCVSAPWFAAVRGSPVDPGWPHVTPDHAVSAPPLTRFRARLAGQDRSRRSSNPRVTDLTPETPGICLKAGVSPPGWSVLGRGRQLPPTGLYRLGGRAPCPWSRRAPRGRAGRRWLLVERPHRLAQGSGACGLCATRSRASPRTTDIARSDPAWPLAHSRLRLASAAGAHPSSLGVRRQATPTTLPAAPGCPLVRRRP
jgi:hypothetical protein